MPAYVWGLSALILLLVPALGLIGTSLLPEPWALPVFMEVKPMSAAGFLAILVMFGPPGLVFLFVQAACRRSLLEARTEPPGGARV